MLISVNPRLILVPVWRAFCKAVRNWPGSGVRDASCRVLQGIGYLGFQVLDSNLEVREVHLGKLSFQLRFFFFQVLDEPDYLLLDAIAFLDAAIHLRNLLLQFLLAAPLLLNANIQILHPAFETSQIFPH